MTFVGPTGTYLFGSLHSLINCLPFSGSFASYSNGLVEGREWRGVDIIENIFGRKS